MAPAAKQWPLMAATVGTIRARGDYPDENGGRGTITVLTWEGEQVQQERIEGRCEDSEV
jgi:hypothetical protein